MTLQLISQIALTLAGVVALTFVIRGLMLTSRAGANDAQWYSAVVRQVGKSDLSGTHTVLMFNHEEDVVHVDCHIPSGWVRRAKPRVTDLVRVLWQPGDARAIAEQTIREGQTLLILGSVALAAIVLLAMVLY